MAGRPNFWLTITIVALLGIIIGMMISGRDAVAAGTSSPGAASHLTALAGHVIANDQPIYVVDSREEVLLVYEYGLGQNGLKFVACRTFKYDKLLSEFTIQATGGRSPSPEDVRKTKKKRR